MNMISKGRLATEVEIALKGGKLISRNKLNSKGIIIDVTTIHGIQTTFNLLQLYHVLFI